MDKIYFYYLKPWLKPVRKLQTHFEDFQTHFSGGLDLGYLPVRQAGSQLEIKFYARQNRNSYFYISSMLYFYYRDDFSVG